MTEESDTPSITAGAQRISWSSSGTVHIERADQTETFQANELTLQLSRGQSPRPLGSILSWLGVSPHRHELNLELRQARGTIIRISAPVDDEEILTEFPRLEVDADTVELSALLQFQKWLETHGANTASAPGAIAALHSHPPKATEEEAELDWRKRLRLLVEPLFLIAFAPVIVMTAAVYWLAGVTPLAWIIPLAVIPLTIWWIRRERPSQNRTDYLLTLAVWGSCLVASTLSLTTVIDYRGGVTAVLIPIGVIGCGALGAAFFLIRRRWGALDSSLARFGNNAWQYYGYGSMLALAHAVPALFYVGSSALLPLDAARLLTVTATAAVPFVLNRKTMSR